MRAADALQSLQDLDLEMLRSEKRLDELPEKKAILDVRAKQREVGALKSKADLLVTKLEAEVRRMQDETAGVDSKIAAEQQKIMSGQVADHKQVQNISRELDALRRRKDKLERDTLDVMERIEKAAEQKSKIDAALAQLADREVQYIERFREQGGDLQTHIADSRRQRDEIARSLDPGLLAQYENLRAAKAGIAIGRLEGESCSVCRMQLPAGAIATLKTGGELGICPQCHRMIIVRDAAQPGSVSGD